MAISTNGTIITRLAGALYNEYLSNASYTELNATPAATVAANMLSSDFAGKTDLQIATTVLSNLGLSSVAGLNNWVAAQLTAAGSTAAAKGAKLVSMLNDFAMMTADATYGSYATTFNSNTAAGLASSQTAKSAGGAFATAGAVAAAAAAAEAKAAADAKAAAEKAVADKAAADAAAAEKAIADKAAADKAAADKVIADAEAAAKAPQKYALTIGVDNGSDFTGKDGADSYTATTTSTGLQTLTAGDNLNGGLGADTLNITSTVAGTVGSGVIATGIETVNVTATAATTVDTSGFTGVTAVANVGSTAAVTVTGLKAIPSVSVTGSNASTTVETTAAVVAGTADAITVNVNGAAVTANASVTANGIETVNVVSSGSASGSTGTTLTVASDSLTTLAVTGDAAAKLAVNLVGATATITGTVTSDAGAHDIAVTARTTDKVSVSMGAGNDQVRVDNMAAIHTIAGGEGTDTLRYSGTTAVALAATANVSGFETVTLSGPASFAMTGAGVTTVNYTEAGSGTFGGLSTGGTVNLNKGGSVTAAAAGAAVTATAAATTTAATYSGTADSLTVNVGLATSATGAASSTVSAIGVESVTFNSLAAATSTEARSVTFSDTTATTAALKTINVTSSIPALTTVAVSNTGTSALTTVNLSGVTGGASFTGGATAGTSITGGAGADSLTGGAGPDNIVGGAGNDTVNGAAGADTIDAGDGTNNITGGTGADTMTGGTGVDTYVFASNATTAATPVATSTSSASDTITNFVSGSDKISITGTHAPQAFLGNFPNIQTALSAAGAAGSLAYSAAFVTGENSLYVFKNTNGTLDADDMVIKLTNVSTLAAGDLLLGAQAAGAAVTLTAAGAVAGQTGATSGTSVDGVASTTANLTAGNDTVTSTVANVLGSTATAGVGTDTLALSITSTAANGAEGTLSSANLANVTGFETITLANFANSTSIANVYNITVADANVENNNTLTVTSSHAGLLADGTLSSAGVTFTASGLTGNRKLNFTGGTAHDVVVGGAGNDTLTGGDGNDTITGGAGVNSLSGGAGNDTVILNADIASTAAHTIAGGSGVADTLQIGAGTVASSVDFTASTLSGFEILDMATNVAVNSATMTAAQFAVFTALGTANVTGNNNDDVIVLTTAGTVSADASIGSFSVIGGSSVTVLAAGQTITEVTATSPASDVSTVTIGNLTVTGRLNAFDATDKLVLTTGANIASIANTANAAGGTLNVGEVTITGLVSMTEAQHDGLIAVSTTAAILATGTTDQITIVDGNLISIDMDADIETYVLGEDSTTDAITVTLAAGNQSATQTDNGGTDDAITFVVGALTLTAASNLVAAGAGADVITVTDGANLAAATITGVPTLSMASGASITLSRAQHETFQAGTTVAAGTNTLTIVGAGTVTAEGVIENYVLANGTNAFTFSTTAAGVTGGTGADTVNVTMANAGAVATTANLGVDAVTDRVVVTNTALALADTSAITISNFGIANDALRLIDTAATATLTDGTFQAIDAGTPAAVTGEIIEITGTNVVSFTAISDGGNIETVIAAALTTSAANVDRTVIIYSGADAGIYHVSDVSTGDIGTGDIVVELVAIITNVGSGALSSVNFF